jgi:hypothetical protein
MLTATFLAIFMIPMFFVVVSKLTGITKPESHPDDPPSAASGHAAGGH